MPHAAEIKGYVTSCSETVLVLILMWDMRELVQKDVLGKLIGEPFDPHSFRATEMIHSHASKVQKYVQPLVWLICPPRNKTIPAVDTENMALAQSRIV